MSNARGGKTVTIGGETYKVILTLGALADIETEMNVTGPGEILNQLVSSHVSSHLCFLKHCLSAAGMPLTDAFILARSVDPSEIEEIAVVFGELMKPLFSEKKAKAEDK
jgi:hypothetical protein